LANGVVTLLAGFLGSWIGALAYRQKSPKPSAISQIEIGDMETL
jgi:hypothetical protein